jgi:hypothetical protein
MTLAKPSRRLLGGLLVATLVAGSAAGAEAATKKKPPVKKTTRTVTLSYRGGCTIDVGTPAANTSAAPGACTTLGAADWAQMAQAKEKYLTVTVTDMTGRAVPGQLWITGTAVGQDTAYPFCGGMKSFLLPDSSFSLDLDSVGAVTSCPGTATTGTVKLVFSNLP